MSTIKPIEDRCGGKAPTSGDAKLDKGRKEIARHAERLRLDYPAMDPVTYNQLICEPITEPLWTFADDLYSEAFDKSRLADPQLPINESAMEWTAVRDRAKKLRDAIAGYLKLGSPVGRFIDKYLW